MRGSDSAMRAFERTNAESHKRAFMKVGTHIRMADGRDGTVVYNGLDGVGVKWGIHYPDEADFEGTSGNCFEPDPPLPDDWPWCPDAMLRDSYPSADLPCVGTDFETITTKGPT